LGYGLKVVSEKYKNMLIKIIEKYMPKGKIYLFGSRAKKEHPLHSDIDIAIDAGEKLNLALMGKIKDGIKESRIPFFVDVIDFNNVDDKMQSQVLEDGILWKS